LFSDLKIQSGNKAIWQLENSVDLVDSITTLPIAGCRLPIGKTKNWIPVGIYP